MIDVGGIGPLITAGAAITAAYSTLRHRQRLRVFELYLGRRNDVLRDVEATIRRLQESRRGDVDGGLGREFFDSGLVLFHKIKGADFGPLPETLAESYFSIVSEWYGVESGDDIADIENRALNVLTLLNGYAHGAMSREISSLSQSFGRRFRRWRERREVCSQRKTRVKGEL
jgi:hypothetical protein